MKLSLYYSHFKNRRIQSTAVTGRGTRQVSSLSSMLVNIYSEAMLRDANEGIRVGGYLIKTVRFADDQATLASSVKGLQLMMGKMQESAGEYDMKINVKKTKVKKICKRPGKEFTIFLEGKQLSQESSHFNYLGALLHRIDPEKNKLDRE